LLSDAYLNPVLANGFEFGMLLGANGLVPDEIPVPAAYALFMPPVLRLKLNIGFLLGSVMNKSLKDLLSCLF